MQRYRLVVALGIIYTVVIITKSLIWQSATDRLEKSLFITQIPCVETVSEHFNWLNQNPYNIINNWALPSLALVVQDDLPRELLLEQDDCAVFYNTGTVQIDPWTNLPQEQLIPPLH